jgi:type I restriction enzyme S subunit
MADIDMLTIADIAADIPYSTQIGPFGKALTPEDYTESGTPLLRGINVNKGRFFDEGFVFVSEEIADSLSKYICNSGEIILVHKGTIGQIGIISEKTRFSCYLMGNSMLRVIVDEKKMLPYFLYYWMCGNDAQWYLHSRLSTVGVPQIHKPLDTLRKLPVPNLSISQQQRIIQPLALLDSLIEINEKMTKCLNEYINSLFRSWFIDFDPVNAKAEGKLPFGMNEETSALFLNSFEDSELGPIPAGWKVKSLLEVSNLYDNLRIPLSSMERKERKGNYPYHGATSAMDYVDDFIYDGVHLLIAEDGSVVNEDGYPVLQYVWGKFWVNNHAHVLQGKDDVTTEHLHQYVKHFYIQPFVTGAVQLKINQKALNNVKLIIAPPNINNAFNEIIQPLYRSIRENKMKNEILTLTRDALLPRLLSGELPVS